MTVYTPTQFANLRDSSPTVQGGASSTGPAANATLVTLTLPNNTALYELTIYSYVSGTVTATEAGNMSVKQGSTVLMTLPVAQSNAVIGAPVSIIVNAAVGTTVTGVVGTATPGASAGYNIHIVARQVG